MNWRDICTLYIRELRSALRERSIIVNTIVIPIVLYPLIIWVTSTGITFVSGQQDSQISRVTLVNVPAQHEGFRRTLIGDKSIQLVDPGAAADPDGDVRKGDLDVAVEFVPPQGDATAIPGNFQARLVYDESRDRSNRAKTRVEQKLTAYRDRFLQAEAARLGLLSAEFRDFSVETSNISTSRQMGQFLLGLLLPMLLIVMLAIGGFYPAVDSTAGERENSTWETTMTFGTSRTNILIAKYLYVATMSLTAASLNLAAMMFSMRTLIAPLRGAREVFSFQIPLRSVPVMLLGAVLMALFVAAGMMILASFARTFKEGQSMVSPFYIAIILPVMFLQVPGQQFTTRLALIPIVNVAMMFREAISGVYSWPLIGITVAVEVACIVIALKVAAMILSYEDVVTGNYNGSFGKLLKERLINNAKKELGA